MQSLKSTGSVTRGKGIEEVQCNIYNLSQPACAKVSTSIEELTGTKHISSDQQRLPSNLRVERGNIDIGKVIFF